MRSYFSYDNRFRPIENPLTLLIFYRLLLVFLIFTVNGCYKTPENVDYVLELSGANRIELEEVLDHYRFPKDSLKLKAAHFLIANMGSKYFYANDSIGKHKDILSYVDSVNKAVDYPKMEYKDTLKSQRLKLERNIIVNSYWDTIKKSMVLYTLLR